MQERHILHDTGTHWVADNGRFYEVFRAGTTASTRVASIGYGAGPQLGLERAIHEANKRSQSELLFPSHR